MVVGASAQMGNQSGEERRRRTRTAREGKRRRNPDTCGRFLSPRQHCTAQPASPISAAAAALPRRSPPKASDQQRVRSSFPRAAFKTPRAELGKPWPLRIRAARWRVERRGERRRRDRDGLDTHSADLSILSSRRNPSRAPEKGTKRPSGVWCGGTAGEGRAERGASVSMMSARSGGEWRLASGTAGAGRKRTKPPPKQAAFESTALPLPAVVRSSSCFFLL